MNLPISIPLAAITRGALAGVAGTAAMDLFWYARQAVRGGGGGADGSGGAFTPHGSRNTAGDAPAYARWEGDGEDEADWLAAPTRARIGKQVYERVTQRPLEVRFARVADAAVHWGYGMWWGGLFGLLAASARRSGTGWGPLFGAAVWGTSYLLLPITGLYRPVWEYPPAELVPDLTAHLIYGTGTAAAFALMARGRDAQPACP